MCYCLVKTPLNKAFMATSESDFTSGIFQFKMCINSFSGYTDSSYIILSTLLLPFGRYWISIEQKAIAELYWLAGIWHRNIYKFIFLQINPIGFSFSMCVFCVSTPTAKEWDSRGDTYPSVHPNGFYAYNDNHGPCHARFVAAFIIQFLCVKMPAHSFRFADIWGWRRLVAYYRIYIIVRISCVHQISSTGRIHLFIYYASKVEWDDRTTKKKKYTNIIVVHIWNERMHSACSHNNTHLQYPPM